MNWNKRRMGRMKEVPDACNSSSHWNQRLKSPNGCPHRCRRRQVLWRTWKLRRATGEPLRWGRGRRRRRRWGWRRPERGESSPLTWKRRRRRGVGWNVGWGTRGEGKSDYYSLKIFMLMSSLFVEERDEVACRWTVPYWLRLQLIITTLPTFLFCPSPYWPPILSFSPFLPRDSLMPKDISIVTKCILQDL